MLIWTRRFRHIRLSAFSAASLLLLTACAKKQGKPPNAAPPQVSVATVEQRDVPLYGDWVATLDGYVNAQIQPQVSGYLIKRGWSLGAARKALVIFGGIGVTMLIPTIFTGSLYLIASLFGFATFSFAAFSTMANVLPADLFRSESVASVSGLSGTGAGLGTIIAFKLIGYFSDARQQTAGHSFDPIVIAAGLVPFVGMILVLLLVRNTKATDLGLVRRI